MRNLKKLVSGLLVMAMLLGTVAFAAKVPADVIGTNYEEAVTTLAALDILKGRDTGEFDPEGNITRAEFAAVVIRMLGQESSVSAAAYQPTMFNDCGSNVQWAWGYINLASNQGIINGYGDGTFGPTDPVTYEQAVKMIVVALGYEVFAQRKGGWPTGYLVVAAENKITSGVPGTNNQPASRGTVALLVNNSLDVYLAEATYINSDGESVTVITTKTILKDKLEVTKKYGVLISTELSAYEGSKNRDGEVSFKESNGQGGFYNPQIAKVGDIAPTDLLGYAVVYYLKYDKTRNENKVISIQEDKIRNKTLTVLAENIANPDLNTFRYWQDKINDQEPKEEKLNAAILINGVVQNSPSSSMLKPASGNVVLVDNTGDGTYNVVFVKQYANFIVESVNTNRSYVEFKYGKSTVQLDTSKSDDYKFAITLDGEAIELKDLQEWDVLSVIADKTRLGNEIGNGSNSNPTFETAQIYVTRNVIQGTIFEIDGNNVYIVNNDGETAKYKKGTGFTDSIDLSDNGRFYLDYEGKIAAADTTKVLGNYAFVIATAVAGTFEPVTDLKLLTANGDIVEVSTDKYVQLNNVRTRSANGTTPVIAGNQLVTYELSSNGYVSSINTAADNTASGSYVKEFSKDFAPATTSYYNQGLLAGKYVVTNATKVFEIPSNMDEKDMGVKDKSAFADRERYLTEVYDVDKDGYATIIIYRPTGGTTRLSSQLALIDRIGEVNNEDNMRVDRLIGYQLGSSITKLTANKSVFASAYSRSAIIAEIENSQGLDGLDFTTTVGYGATAKNFGQWYAAYNVAYSYFPGNLIIYSQNSKGEIDSAMKIYPAEAPALTGFDQAGKYKMIPYIAYDNQFNPKDNADLEVIVGTVGTKGTDFFFVNTMRKNKELAVGIADPNNFYQAFEDSTERIGRGSNTKVYYVDTTRDSSVRVQVRDNSFSYAEKDDTVVVRKYQGTVRDVVIYRNYDVSIFNSLFVPNDNA